MRYLGTNYEEACLMSLNEYVIRMYAFKLKRQDEMELLHYQVWLSQRVVTATDKKGNYVFRKFDDFYKTEQPSKKVNPDLYRVANRLKEMREKGGE